MKMRRVLMLSVGLMLIFAAIAAPVSAGGWATIELTKPVDSAIVGELVVFQFQVLQHGVSALDSVAPTVEAIHADTGDKLEAKATEVTKANYSATLTFDQPGRWKLRASSTVFPVTTSFPTLYVLSKGETAAPGTPTSAVATEEVQLINYSFVPNNLEIAAGTTVKFVNSDTAKHEVAFYEDSMDDHGILDPESEFTVTFIDPGEYHLACGPHPGMSATVIVK